MKTTANRVLVGAISLAMLAGLQAPTGASPVAAELETTTRNGVIAALDGDGTHEMSVIRIFSPDGDESRVLRQYLNEGDYAFQIAFQPGSPWLWVGEDVDKDLTLKKIHVDTGEEFDAPEKLGVSLEFSPDGTRAVYRGTDRKGNPWLAIANADGTHQRKIRRFESGFGSARWSPDGKRIAFISDGDIYTIQPAGGRPKLLRDHQPKRPAFTLTWSPDGQRLAFSQIGTDENRGVWVLDAKDGSNAKRIYSEAAFLPAWEPEGDRILHWYWAGAMKTTDVETRTTEPFNEIDPEWEMQWSTACTITGTPLGEKIVGTDGPDVICGLEGDDEIVGGGGNDIIYGGPGADDISGSVGDDVIAGQEGGDVLRGQAGNDVISDIFGKDDLRGGRGADHLYARDNNKDALVGGAQHDRCWFMAVDEPSQCESIGYRGKP